MRGERPLLRLGEGQDAPLPAARQAEVAADRLVEPQAVLVVRPPAVGTDGLEPASRQQDVLVATPPPLAAPAPRRRSPWTVVSVARRQGVRHLMPQRV